jgi:hypothetical protein
MVLDNPNHKDMAGQRAFFSRIDVIAIATAGENSNGRANQPVARVSAAIPGAFISE